MMDRMGFKWEGCKDDIYRCLVPRDWAWLKGRPAVSLEFLDLSVYYHIRPRGKERAAVTWITDSMLQDWDIGMERLDIQAAYNARAEGYSIRKVSDVLGIGDTGADLYMLTNKSSSYGAAGMLDVRMVGEFAAEKAADLYILPSSIHEVLLLPADRFNDEKGMCGMVTEVNQALVFPNDRLSDHIYKYERETGTIRAVGDNKDPRPQKG